MTKITTAVGRHYSDPSYPVKDLQNPFGNVSWRLVYKHILSVKDTNLNKTYKYIFICNATSYYLARKKCFTFLAKKGIIDVQESQFELKPNIT
jgi:hypothetical protein